MESLRNFFKARRNYFDVVLLAHYNSPSEQLNCTPASPVRPQSGPGPTKACGVETGAAPQRRSCLGTGRPKGLDPKDRAAKRELRARAGDQGHRGVWAVVSGAWAVAMTGRIGSCRRRTEVFHLRVGRGRGGAGRTYTSAARACSARVLCAWLCYCRAALKMERGSWPNEQRVRPSSARQACPCGPLKL